MVYDFRYREVFRSLDVLLDGVWLTVQLSALAMVFGLVIAIVCAVIKTDGPRPARFLVNVYVEIIRNTPFLVQIFIVFFGLPSLGLRLTASAEWSAGVILRSTVRRPGSQSSPRDDRTDRRQSGDRGRSAAGSPHPS